MKLKPWRQVIDPREDLREGKSLDTAEFAVHLDMVHDKRGYELYWKPEQFFARTYLTRSLLDLAAEAIRRLSGVQEATSAIFNMTTQFGGGKTHALTLLYHLAQNGPSASRWVGVPRILQQAGVRQVPQAKVAVFVGMRFDGRGGDDGTPRRRTPWGEIAWQLGGKAGYQIMAPFDVEGRAPGGDTIAKLFALVDQPILILMDELINYVSRYRQGGLGGQLYNFLFNLAEETRSHENVVLAVSI
ncbi:MAG: ATP-binding protein, partial [Anaerolineales bacterium]|nr:ATP-binding protein [Anaerolineales bacterium]